MTITELFCGKEVIKYDAGSVPIRVSHVSHIDLMRELMESVVKELFNVIKRLTGTDNKSAAIDRLRHTADVPKRHICQLIDELFDCIDRFYTTALSVINYKPRLAAHYVATDDGTDAQARHYTLQRCPLGRHIPYRHQSRGSDDPASENDRTNKK